MGLGNFGPKIRKISEFLDQDLSRRGAGLFLVPFLGIENNPAPLRDNSWRVKFGGFAATWPDKIANFDDFAWAKGYRSRGPVDRSTGPTGR